MDEDFETGDEHFTECDDCGETVDEHGICQECLKEGRSFPQCSAITVAGTQCHLAPQEGSEFCDIHSRTTFGKIE